MHREISAQWDSYFQELPGCGGRIEKGTLCSFPSAGGRSYPLEVKEVSDDGVWFLTGAEHPEGAGRNIVIRLREKAPSQIDKRHLEGAHTEEFIADSKPWIVMEIFRVFRWTNCYYRWTTLQ